MGNLCGRIFSWQLSIHISIMITPTITVITPTITQVITTTTPVGVGLSRSCLDTATITQTRLMTR
ncbi:MAG: hypothetical protein ACKN98_05240 [Candidatus Limnocylindrus sp.]